MSHPWRTGKPPENVPPKMRYAKEVKTAGLRRAFENSGLTKGQLAERLGWMRPNLDKLNRALGYRPDSSSKGKRQIVRQTMSYELAVKICEAMNASPFEVGV